MTTAQLRILIVNALAKAGVPAHIEVTGEYPLRPKSEPKGPRNVRGTWDAQVSGKEDK